jgi:alpha-L-fucosidase
MKRTPQAIALSLSVNEAGPAVTTAVGKGAQLAVSVPEQDNGLIRDIESDVLSRLCHDISATDTEP